MTAPRPLGSRPLALVLSLALAGGGVALLSAPAAAAGPSDTFLYGLSIDDDNSPGLARIRSGTGVTGAIIDITGVDRSDLLVGIDVRPANGRLYAVGADLTGRGDDNLYMINPASGRATKVGAPLVPALDGTSFGVDFNPVADRLRVVSDTGQNLRINPNTAGPATADTELKYAPADRNNGVVPIITAAAYTNNVAGATATRLYDIDFGTDSLVTQAPNEGRLNTVGELGIVLKDEYVGFDIRGADGLAFLAALEDVANRPDGAVRLYTVDLATGATTRLLDALPPSIEDIAVAAEPPVLGGAVTQRPLLGRTTTITGTAVPGATVDIFFKKRTDAAYSDRRTLTASPAGTYSTTFVANDDYRVYAQVGSVRSSGLLFQASPIVGLPQGGTVRKGSTYTVNGRGTPGSTVYLNFRRATDRPGTYPVQRTVTVGANGTWRRPVLASVDYRLYVARTASAPVGLTYLFQAR